MILSRILKKPLFGTVLRGVIQTGDFAGRHSELTIQVYNRLSKSSGLIPPAVGFLFDRENRSETEIEDLTRMGIDLIPRRMYENYLINSDAIAAILEKDVPSLDKKQTRTRAEAWLSEHGNDGEYWSGKSGKDKPSDEAWIVGVDGAKLLNSLFNHLTDGRCSFADNKVAYCVALTEYLIEHKPESLREIADLIAQVIDKGRERLDSQTVVEND